MKPSVEFVAGESDMLLRKAPELSSKRLMFEGPEFSTEITLFEGYYAKLHGSTKSFRLMETDEIVGFMATTACSYGDWGPFTAT